MIVLHVARARTDSINIRGSLGKTRGRALDYRRYFPLFFRMQCPHPFHSLSPFYVFVFLFLSLSLFLPFIPVVSRRVAFLSRFSLARSRPPFLSFNVVPARARYATSFPFRSHTSRRPRLLSLSLALAPFDSSPPAGSLPFSGTDGDSSLPDPVSALDCYPPSRNGNCPGVLFPGSRARETELPDNPLICPVITSHRRSSPISCTADRTSRLSS